jgi:DNA-binding CsgD family transcriptional regulator
MKDMAIDARSEQMLELLAQGASNRLVARRMGYSEGTMRVYLHNLYKRIGVRNKTEAVIWHLHRSGPLNGERWSATASTPGADESFGAMALREDLYTALGVMSSFLGAYGRVWEVGIRLKGEDADEATLARRAQSRLLWQALLRGDFAYGKGLCEAGADEHLLADSPPDAVVLAALLLLGGYSSAADHLIERLPQKRKGGASVSAREAALVAALRNALYDKDDEALTALYDAAAESGAAPVLKQLAMVMLFQAYKARRDRERAVGTANALWAEAEAARQNLEAMGVRPLGRDTTIPRPGKPAARDRNGAREKVAAGR